MTETPNNDFGLNDLLEPWHDARIFTSQRVGLGCVNLQGDTFQYETQNSFRVEGLVALLDEDRHQLALCKCKICMDDRIRVGLHRTRIQCSTGD